MPTFDRGFKTWAERMSISIRHELGLYPTDPLPPQSLADHLGVILWTPKNVPGLPEEIMNRLLRTDPRGWSAVSIQVEKTRLIIFNPTTSKGRQTNDITHELAHILLEHPPTTVILSADFNIAMRTFDQKQEDEANWLAGCLLLPREALVFARQRKWTNEMIAEKYNVSRTLATYRTNMTGVNLQFSRGRAEA
jgi:hypothetical protein